MNTFTIACVLTQILVVMPTDANEEVNNSNEAKPTNLVAESDVTYRLYTRRTPFEPVELDLHNDRDSLNPHLPFKFIIHGWHQSSADKRMLVMKDAYLKKWDYNVIAVDWSKPAKENYVPVTILLSKEVGRYIGKFIIDLNKTLSVSYQQIHLIGFSFGAHIAGIAGQYVDYIENKKIARITGLDAAGPVFNRLENDDKLNPGDASFIDTIHTDGGVFGYSEPYGDADFYPNNGTAPQPMCTELKTYTDINWCSHGYSVAYFTESMHSLRFVGTECNDMATYLSGKCKDNPKAIMGENINTTRQGMYYLTS